MLTKFHVKSFKSLEDVTVELGRVNVFIGANGSGKSNLLEAIGVLGAAANGRVDDEALLRRGVRPGLPALYKSSFRGKEEPQYIEFSGNSGIAKYSVRLVNSSNSPEPAWKFWAEQLSEQTDKGEEYIVNRPSDSNLRLNPSAGYAALKYVELPESSVGGALMTDLQQYAIYAPETTMLRGLTLDQQIRAPIGLQGGRLAEAVDLLFEHLSEVEVNPPFSAWTDVHNAIEELIDWADRFGSEELISSADRFGPSGPDVVSLASDRLESNLVLRFRDK